MLANSLYCVALGPLCPSVRVDVDVFGSLCASVYVCTRVSVVCVWRGVCRKEISHQQRKRERQWSEWPTSSKTDHFPDSQFQFLDPGFSSPSNPFYAEACPRSENNIHFSSANTHNENFHSFTFYLHLLFLLLKILSFPFSLSQPLTFQARTILIFAICLNECKCADIVVAVIFLMDRHILIPRLKSRKKSFPFFFFSKETKVAPFLLLFWAKKTLCLFCRLWFHCWAISIYFTFVAEKHCFPIVPWNGKKVHG